MHLLAKICVSLTLAALAGHRYVEWFRPRAALGGKRGLFVRFLVLCSMYALLRALVLTGELFTTGSDYPFRPVISSITLGEFLTLSIAVSGAKNSAQCLRQGFGKRVPVRSAAESLVFSTGIYFGLFWSFWVLLCKDARTWTSGDSLSVLYTATVLVPSLVAISFLRLEKSRYIALSLLFSSVICTYSNIEGRPLELCSMLMYHLLYILGYRALDRTSTYLSRRIGHGISYFGPLFDNMATGLLPDLDQSIFGFGRAQ